MIDALEEDWVEDFRAGQGRSRAANWDVVKLVQEAMTAERWVVR